MATASITTRSCAQRAAMYTAQRPSASAVNAPCCQQAAFSSTTKPARGDAFTARAFLGLGAPPAQGGIYDVTVKDIDGRDLKMSKYAGKVVLVCNVASQCGFTPQYNDLVELHKKYRSKGFEIIAAPCNQFGAQEPGTNAEIKKFAQARGAKFPLLSKLDVNGPETSPLYKELKKQQGGMLTSDVKWNFTKFLVDREGNVVNRYFSTTTPADIASDVEKYL